MVLHLYGTKKWEGEGIGRREDDVDAPILPIGAPPHPLRAQSHCDKSVENKFLKLVGCKTEDFSRICEDPAAERLADVNELNQRGLHMWSEG